MRIDLNQGILSSILSQPIKKSCVPCGLSANDVFYHFIKEDLVSFSICISSSLKTTGRKIGEGLSEIQMWKSTQKLPWTPHVAIIPIKEESKVSGWVVQKYIFKKKGRKDEDVLQETVNIVNEISPSSLRKFAREGNLKQPLKKIKVLVDNLAEIIKDLDNEIITNKVKYLFDDTRFPLSDYQGGIYKEGKGQWLVANKYRIKIKTSHSFTCPFTKKKLSTRTPLTLEMQSVLRTTKVCSGTIISPKLILTAQNNRKLEHVDYTNIIFCPGLNVNALVMIQDKKFRQLRPSEFSSITSKDANLESEKLTTDWHSELPVGAGCGVVGDVDIFVLDQPWDKKMTEQSVSSIKIANPEKIPIGVGMSVHICGYPNKLQGRLWYTKGMITKLEEDYFFYTSVGLVPGVSGSSIWTSDIIEGTMEIQS